MKKINIYLIFIICLFHLRASAMADLKVLLEITGPYQTNCYLIYDTKSKEAAMIDPGWKIDKLVYFIKNNNLGLKYIFITHGHSDHYYFVGELKKLFPEVKWCLHKDDYENIIKCSDWHLKAYGQEWVDKTKKNPEASRYLDFDAKTIGVPDIFVEGNQSYKIGSGIIKTIYTPGHSPGSICYFTDNILFSGDVLFYKSVGKLDKLTSDKEIFIKSVRELYRLFPDSTKVYPGHNQYTNIGAEKKENKRITMDGGEYDSK